MTKEDLEKLLRDVQERKITVAEGLKILRELPYKDIGIAKIDYHRELRKGQPEVIYCEGKTTAQIEQIVSEMLKTNQNILATRANPEVYRCVQSLYNDAEYYETARIIFIRKKELIFPETYIAVVSAGTSDIPVAEEAAVTAELFGNRVQRIYDVGVAGLHRLLGHLDVIQNAKVIIAVAGMEGALASVLGGLVDKPVLAVPTSVGYGAGFKGLSALLSMLNSCASGVAVLNIDNGFGAGYMASMINKL